MPANNLTPDIEALATVISNELLFGQVLIRRGGAGFELRHMIDAESEVAGLRLLEEKEIRPLAQFASSGAFRPLKSAPNLRAGWRFIATDVAALGAALDRLYPGAVADWFAAKAPEPPITSYREFTARQTGMYRITTHLDDALAGAMIRACCHVDFCLKRRLWSVGGLPPDGLKSAFGRVGALRRPDAAARRPYLGLVEKLICAPPDQPGEKSLIPCLEPCAILLEFARKIARLEQQETPPSEQNVAAPVAECDFDAPNNPRRLRFILEKQAQAVTSQLD